MNKILCGLEGLWHSLISGHNIEGHTYVATEYHENCAVMVDYCERCGNPQITWIRMDDAHRLELKKQYPQLQEKE